jgi:RHS repeat-associated protein
VAAVALVVTLIAGVTSGDMGARPPHSTVLNATGPHADIALTSGSTVQGVASYSQDELWGADNPAEKCTGCAAQSLMDEDSAQSIQPDTDVDPFTGDFNTSMDLFSVPTVGGDLEMSLNYDAQRAATEQSSNIQYAYSTPGPFGYGWQSTANASVGEDGFGDLFFNEPNGAGVNFYTTSSDGCESTAPPGTASQGNYVSDQDYQKYTVSTSTVPYCGAYRVDAQAGYVPASRSFVLDLEGGKQVEAYNEFGQLASSGTYDDPAAIQYAYTPSYGNGGPSNCSGTGVAECFVETDSSDSRSVLVKEAGPDFNGPASDIFDPYGVEYSVAFTDGSQNLNAITNMSASNNPTTRWGYSTGGNGALNHEMTDIIDPDGNLETITYATSGSGTPGPFNSGMVASITDGTGQYPTDYSYAYANCVTSNDCWNGQTTTVGYPDGEQDQDNYAEGQLTYNCYGTNLQNNQDVCWQFSLPDTNETQEGWATETIKVSAEPNESAYVVTDTAGDVVQYTDPLGNTTNMMYNDNGRNDFDSLCWEAPPGVAIGSGASCTSPPSGSTSYTYDSAGNQLTETDALGNATHDGYYANGMLCWEAPPTVTTAGSSCSGSSPSGAPMGSTAYTYDPDGDLGTTVVDYGDGSNTETTGDGYNQDGQLTSSTPPNGEESQNPTPYETTYVYNPTGTVQSMSQPQPGASGGFETTTYQYDNDNHQIYMANSAESTTTAYDPDGRACWSEVSIPVISAPTSPPSCTAPSSSLSNEVTKYGYWADTDAYSSVTDPRSFVTSYAYGDGMDPTSPTMIEDPAQAETQYNAYDNFGNVCASGSVNPTSCGPTTGDTYDLYDLEGQLQESVDPSGIPTTYTYEDPEYPTDPTQSTYGSGTGLQIITTSYDADGNAIIEHQVQGNTTVSLGYDPDGRLSWRAPFRSVAAWNTPPSGTSVSYYQYNATGQQKSMTDNYGTSSAVTDNYSYDSDGSLTSATDDNGRTMGYVYNDAEEVDCIAYPLPSGGASNCNSGANPSSNLIVNRSYDSIGRLSSVTDWNGNTTSFSSYDQQSEVGQISYPSLTSEAVQYGYDASGDLTSESDGNRFLGSLGESWGYNNDNQVNSSNTLGVGNVGPDTYDSLKQISEAANPTVGGGSTTDTYSFGETPGSTVTNGGGIVTDKPANESGTIAYSYNGAAELTSVNNPNLPSNQTTSFAYTPDGQRCWSVQSTVSNPTCSIAPSNATSYGWDGYGELCWSGTTTETGTSCQTPPLGTTSYTYSGNGLRMTETPATGSKLKFSWDTIDGSTPLDVDDGTNYYIYGPLLFGGTAPIEQVPVSSTTTPSYLSSDPSGVQVVFSQSGALKEQATYTNFGVQILQNSTTSVTPFGFQGSYTDPATGPQTAGLIYLVNRYYDPSTDQFLSVDPLVAETGQPYAFTGDNPLNASDPLGLCSGPDGMCTGSNGKPVLTTSRDSTDYAPAPSRPGPNRMGTPASCIGAGAPSQIAGCGTYIITGKPSAPTESPTWQWSNAVTTFLTVFGLAGSEASAATGATERTTVVLGHYPEYTELGARIGAQTFSLPADVWEAMSPAEQWASNQAFLDEAIANDSAFQLATPADAAREGSFYERELQYMTSEGYTVSGDGMSLLPPG